MAALAAAASAQANPVFARRYGLRCHFCHSGYPKLTVIGQRFKERGFRLEKEDPFEASRWLRATPAAVRLRANASFFEEGGSSWVGLVKGISAGNLGPRVSYWLDDGATKAEGERVRHSKPDNAWVRVELIPGGKLYVRGGRMELNIPFTQARTPHLFPYEIYTANTGLEADNIGSFQDGVEVGGDLPQDLRWSAAVVKGHDSPETRAGFEGASRFEGNLFLSLTKRVDKNRLGAFGYFGRNRLPVVAIPELFESNRDTLLRLGVSGDVAYRRLNVYGLFMHGRNDNSTGIGRALAFDGGFLQADYHLRDEIALTARLNAVNRPVANGDEKATYTSIVPGAQCWILDRLKLSFEYSINFQGRPSVGAVQAEVAF